MVIQILEMNKIGKKKKLLEEVINTAGNEILKRQQIL
jgi:hypothetical protein